MSRQRQHTPILYPYQPCAASRIKRNKKPRTELATRLRCGKIFTPPVIQIRLIFEINEAVWKDLTITDAAIRELGDPPECPAIEADNLYCVTLLSETGDAVKTLSRNWTACRFMHGVMHTEKLSCLHFTPAYIIPRKSAKVRPKGLRWAICELGRRFKDQRALYIGPKLNRQDITGIGQELPAIAAMHPHWATCMEGNIVPFVSAPDLLVNPFARGGFVNALCVYHANTNDKITLGAISIFGRHQCYGSGFFTNSGNSGKGK